MQVHIVFPTESPVSESKIKVISQDVSLPMDESNLVKKFKSLDISGEDARHDPAKSESMTATPPPSPVKATSQCVSRPTDESDPVKESVPLGDVCDDDTGHDAAKSESLTATPPPSPETSKVALPAVESPPAIPHPEPAMDPNTKRRKRSPRREYIPIPRSPLSKLDDSGERGFVYLGYRCSIEGCDFAASSRQHVQHHMKTTSHRNVVKNKTVAANDDEIF